MSRSATSYWRKCKIHWLSQYGAADKTLKKMLTTLPWKILNANKIGNSIARFSSMLLVEKLLVKRTDNLCDMKFLWDTDIS
jgi:hypothetical protein